MLKTARFTSQPEKPGGLLGVILRTILRAIQLIIALVIAGIYGQDLHRAQQAAEPTDSRWVYAVVVAGFSIITTVVYLIPAIKSSKFFAWDGILFIFWLVLFGIYGKLYLPEDCEGSGGCGRMKTAVWFDMLGMIFWFGSFVGGAFMFWKERHSHSIFTGRGSVV